MSFVICHLPAADAASSARSQHTEVELVSEVSAVAPGQPFLVALRMTMDPHWHTYWKNPGDSGLATSIEWTLPPGFKAGPILWPTPQRIEVGGLVSYAYEGEVFLLTEITPPADLKPGGTVDLRAQVDWLECKEICIPGAAALAITLQTGTHPQPSARGHALVERGRKAVPEPFAGRVRLESTASHFRFHFADLQAGETRSVARVFFFSATSEAVDYADLQSWTAGADGGLLEIKKSANAAAVSKLQGVLAITRQDGSRTAFEVGLDAEPARVGAGSTGGSALIPMVVLGFLGGLILNLMPCVFPVLGLKIMGVARQSGESRRRIVQHGLAYTAGVLASFWILAGCLLLLRAGGEQLGWGFQLQNPVFVYLLTALLLLFGLNMSGVFEVGASLVGVGAGPARQPSLAGSLASGVLATVVATPCAAPFLAPALGAALALPALPSMGLFTAIALGLAFPFLLLSFFPRWVAVLPKPGPWMEWLKQGLAFLLYGAAAYLLWVLAGQVDESRLLSVGFSLVALAAAAWLYGRTASPALEVRTRVLGLAGALILGSAALAYGWPQAPKPTTVVWEPWSGARVAALQAEGRPVYVDFTARWCATCQVNKRVVFGSKDVLEAFARKNVAALKADWTNQDPVITAELAKWGRSAVPFNLLYLPGRSEPDVLPEVLTPGIVLQALEGR